MQIDFNRDPLELTMSGGQPFPKVSAVNHIENDMFGKLTGDASVPGPLADAGAKRVWQVDPRTAVQRS